MTLSGPMVFLLAPPVTQTPLRWLPSACVPLISVPIRFPVTMLFEARSHTPMPKSLLLDRFPCPIGPIPEFRSPPMTLFLPWRATTNPVPVKWITCNPRMVFPSETISRPGIHVSLASWLPSRITPALLASMVRFPWWICGSPLVTEMATCASGGKTLGSNVIVSPLCASCIAWRKVPGPLSAALVTSRVLPWGVGVGVGGTAVAVGSASVGVSVSGAAVGVGPGVQDERASTAPIIKENKAFFIIHSPVSSIGWLRLQSQFHRVHEVAVHALWAREPGSPHTAQSRRASRPGQTAAIAPDKFLQIPVR